MSFALQSLMDNDKSSLAEPTVLAVVDVLVDAEIAAVYDRCSSLSILPRLIPHLDEVVPLEPKGVRYRCQGKRAGRPIEWEIEVTERVPNEKIAWRNLSHPECDSAAVVRLKAVAPRRTRLVYRLDRLRSARDGVRRAGDAAGDISAPESAAR
jgi:uncharacterized membrane protein